MDEQRLKQDTLRISIKEGIFASAMTGFTQEHFIPFLLLIGGTARHVGFLGALPNLAASLIQLSSSRVVTHFRSRRRTVVFFVFLQAISLAPMAVLAVVGWPMPWLFIACVVLFTASSALAGPAWGSLMSDLVDHDKRGAFFGFRNRLLGFATVLATFIAGFLLYIGKRIGPNRAFGVVFMLAFIWRMVSWRYLKKMYETPWHHDKNADFTLWQFLRRLPESNFAKFAVFVACMSFSVNIASPFFAVFMLETLKFNYLLYIVVTLAATLTVHTAIARWGRHADRIGNLKVIRITTPLIGLVPLPWLFNHDPRFLIVAQLFSGFVWAGFNLCTSNFIYDAVTPQKRTRCIGYFNTLNGVAVCCGCLLGGFLLPLLPPLFGHRLLSLFALSSALRLVAAFVMLPRLKEVRPVEHVKSDDLFFSMIGIRPIFGVERKTIRY